MYFQLVLKLFSCSVVSDSLRPHGLQHTGLPCPSPTPRVYSNSCPLSRWCHLTISFSVIFFSSCLQSFLASGPFPMSQFFSSGSQSIGTSASASVLPMNIQGWFPLGLTSSISLVWKGTLKSLLKHHSSKASVLQCSDFFMVRLSHLYMTTGKTIALTRWTFISKVISLLFNMLSRFVKAFLPRNKRLFNFTAAVTIHSEFGAQENKICHCFHFSLIYLLWSDGIRCHDLSFWMLNF